MAAYRTIVGRTRAALPDTLIVLVGPYWNLQYNAEMWATPKYAIGSLASSTGPAMTW